jgi:hypothetical protein
LIVVVMFGARFPALSSMNQQFDLPH